MIVATTVAIIHGGALPAFALIFGDFIDLFLDQGRTETISSQVAYAISETGNSYILDIDELDCDNSDPFNVSAIMEFLPLLINVTFEVAGISEPAVFPIIITEMSNWATVFRDIDSQCLDSQAFIEAIDMFVFVFLGIAVGVFILAYFEISLFQTACERQVKKIRLAFYKAIMRQEVGWFDANPSGELASRIVE